MNQQDDKKPEKRSGQTGKNLIKLLPAAAVIAAVTVSGLQPEVSAEETTKTVSGPKSDVINAKELESLLTTAYSYDYAEVQEDFSSEESSDSQKEKTSAKKKAKTGRIKKGGAKVLPVKSAAASSQGQGTTTTPTTSVPEDGYKDGTYQGSGTGFGGTITVQVKVSGGKITAINVLSASGETGSYFASAKGVISKMISAQSPNVDAVSGATYSSNGIIQAVQNALSKAGNGGKKTTTKKKKTRRKQQQWLLHQHRHQHQQQHVRLLQNRLRRRDRKRKLFTLRTELTLQKPEDSRGG